MHSYCLRAQALAQDTSGKVLRYPWQPTRSQIPTAPGVYRFSRDGTTLYVGKAINLRNRLSSYFVSSDKLIPRIANMVENANQVTWTVVSSDSEARILERTWIDAHNPEYNVALKDAGLHTRIALTSSPAKLQLWHGPPRERTETYGPWPGINTRLLLDTVAHVTGVRTCTNPTFRVARVAERPCLLGRTGTCSAPCVASPAEGEPGISAQEYEQRVSAARRLLRGRLSGIVDEITEKMNEASSEMRYEVAAKMRDRREALMALTSETRFLDLPETNADIITAHLSPPVAALAVANVRGGVLVDLTTSWTTAHKLDEVLAEMVEAHYSNREPGSKILSDLVEPESLNQTMGSINWTRIPPGTYSDLLAMLTRNAISACRRVITENAASLPQRDKASLELTRALGLAAPPMRIEAIDVAHLQGTDARASVVTFLDGKSVGSQHRVYIIPEEYAGDDVASIRWVVERRMRRDSDGNLRRPDPDLILVDGGHLQVDAAISALESLELETPVAGLAKRLEEICLPGGEVIILPRQSPALYLLMRLRDAAHTHANKAHRRGRGKQALRSEFERLPGVGPVRAKALADVYGTVQALAEASQSSLGSVRGIGPELAQTLHEHLHLDYQQTTAGPDGPKLEHQKVLGTSRPDDEEQVLPGPDSDR